MSGLMNFEFMGGSMGRAVGGAIVKGAKIAIEEKTHILLLLPLVAQECKKELSV